jgi:hypothetical protein
MLNTVRYANLEDQVRFQPVSIDPVSDYIARYTMDDATGADETGTYDGTITGTITQTGVLNNAQRFTEASSDRLTCPSALLPTSGDFTVTAWVKNTVSPSVNDVIVSQWGGSDAGRVFLSKSSDSSKLKLFYGGTSVVIDSGVSLASNTWHFVAWRRESGTSYISVDTGAEASAPHGDIENTVTEIGGDSSASLGFGGDIDDVRIYDRALSSTELTALYNWYDYTP